jgi:molecular chaperone HscB
MDAADSAALAGTKDKMVALLDRRRYVRNLVRDVNEAVAA